MVHQKRAAAGSAALQGGNFARRASCSGSNIKSPLPSSRQGCRDPVPGTVTGFSRSQALLGNAGGGSSASRIGSRASGVRVPKQSLGTRKRENFWESREVSENNYAFLASYSLKIKAGSKNSFSANLCVLCASAPLRLCASAVQKKEIATAEAQSTQRFAEKKRNQRVNRNTRQRSDLIAAPPRYVQVRISRMSRFF